MLLIWLLAASAAEAPPTAWRVEVPIVATATAPASNVDTEVLPWLGVRVGHTFALSDDDEGAAWGVDGGLLGAYARAGTSQVAATRGLAVLEVRGSFIPLRVTSTFSALAPYVYAGAAAGGGFVDVKAFGDDHAQPLLTWSARAGAGAALTVHGVRTSLELGAGVRDLRFELSTALALGGEF